MTAPTAWQLDALREVAHLASAQAASLVAKLVGDAGVWVDTPETTETKEPELAWLVGGRDVPVVATSFALEGDVSGHLWWVLRRDDAMRLGQRLLLRGTVSGPMGGQWTTACAEAANLVASACASAIGTMVRAKVLPSTPEMHHSHAGGLHTHDGSGAATTVISARFLASNAPFFSGWLVLFFDDATRLDLQRRLGT
ncbi:MAG: hypothetical protein JNG84_04690 [Archangium sp.]|nr:hypothetical protein [Archangium sp.]